MKKKNKKENKKNKLNLGCGSKNLEGFINVDKFGNPDKKVDLEHFPWPWKDNSVNEIVLSHVLEHLGKDTDTFLNIMKELYRISSKNTIIHINVPHPRSDAYLGDPTHVRPVTLNILNLFSKEENKKSVEQGWANTTLALFLDIDFKVIHNKIKLMPYWHNRYENKQITNDELDFALMHYYNVVEEMEFKLKVIKE